MCEQIIQNLQDDESFTFMPDPFCHYYDSPEKILTVITMNLTLHIALN